jgi:hypothetical protein
MSHYLQVIHGAPAQLFLYITTMEPIAEIWAHIIGIFPYLKVLVFIIRGVSFSTISI